MRNGWRKGQFLIIDSESGMTRYSGQVKKDYTGEMVTKRYTDCEQPQDFIKPSDDPQPIPFSNPGLSDFDVDDCISPFVGNTTVRARESPASHLFDECPPTALAIQTKTITIDSGQSSAAVTIDIVDPDYTVVFLNGVRVTHTSDSPDRIYARVTLTDATTVTINRGGTGNALTAEVTIIEFSSSWVESVTQGTISITTGTSNTATISEVDTTRSAVIFQGYSTTETSFGGFVSANVALTNSTTVTATMANAGSDDIVGYTVIQFDSSIINSVQSVLYSATDSNAIETVTLSTTVTPANCITFFNGEAVDRSEMTKYGSHIVELTDANTVTFTSQGTASTTKKLRATVVEFKSGVIYSRQTGTTQMASAASNTSNVTSVDTTRSLLNFNNINISNGSGTSPATIRSSAVLTNATTVTVSKTTAGTNTVNVAWELIEFA